MSVDLYPLPRHCGVDTKLDTGLCYVLECIARMSLTDFYSFANPVLVRVGPITSFEDFYIHEARLTQRSPYFEAAFEKLREDGESEVLELPDDDPLVFQLYARYIYNPLSISELELAQDTRNGIYDTYIELLNAYIFGEKVQDSGFQNEIMNQILVCMGDMHKPPTVSRPASSSKRIVKPLIELLYPALPPDSIGRGLAVETFIVLWSHSDELQNFVPHLSRELLTEIAEMLLSGDKDHIRDAWAQAINGDYSYYHSTRSDEH